MRANDGTGQRGYSAPKHVWVQLADETEAVGILLDWRTTDAGRWEAWVVWAADSDGAASAHLEWVDEARVRPRT